MRRRAERRDTMLSLLDLVKLPRAFAVALRRASSRAARSSASASRAPSPGGRA